MVKACAGITHLQLKLQVISCLTDTPIRLVGGITQYSGNVEVFYNNHWGTICEREFTKENAQVICNQLGYNFSRYVLLIIVLFLWYFSHLL